MPRSGDPETVGFPLPSIAYCCTDPATGDASSASGRQRSRASHVTANHLPVFSVQPATRSAMKATWPTWTSPSHKSTLQRDVSRTNEASTMHRLPAHISATTPMNELIVPGHPREPKVSSPRRIGCDQAPRPPRHDYSLGPASGEFLDSRSVELVTCLGCAMGRCCARSIWAETTGREKWP